jgi:plastocyanin
MGRSAPPRVTITRLAAVAAAAVLASALAACADDSNASTANVINAVNAAGATETTAGAETPARFDVDIANFQFTPAEVTIPAGTEVVWTNNDTDVHSIVSDGDMFASSEVFEPGESYSVVFTEPGTYPYICGVHPFMMGTITVE